MRWLAVGVACLFIGCIPKLYLRRYLSFEEIAGIEMGSYGTLEQDKDEPFFTCEVPLEYRLERPGNTLVLEIDSFGTYAEATIELSQAGTLGIVPRPDLVVRPERPGACGYYKQGYFKQAKPHDQAFRFRWRIFDNPVSPSECKIAFDVVDSPGAVIGKERLPFELKTNGVFWEFDSL